MHPPGRVPVIQFQGYASLLGTDLPSSVTIKNFVDLETDDQVDDTTPHGTACAEIIYDLVPDASLYLVKIATNLDLEEAVVWLIDQDVDVISTSLGWYNLTPGDGTGFFEDLVNQAKDAGIFWATAASNDRENHWGGLFNADGDAEHNFSGTQEINYFGPGDGTAYVINPGYTIRAFLRWDDWTNVDQDFNLALLRYDSGTWVLVALGANTQNGQAGQTPTEYLSYTTSGDSAPYGIVIINNGATKIVNFELFVPKFLRMDENVYERSLANLADAPSAMTVAALDSTSPYPQESYSSEGPTNGPGGTLTGGAIKPDISAYANVATQSYTGSTFNGTSAATPHAAGAAAIVLSAYPGYTPDQLVSFLEGRAEDMGDAGKDSVFGSGRLTLGDPPSLITEFNVTSTTPVNAAFDVASNANISAITDEAVDYSTLSAQTFTVRGEQSGLYSGTYSGSSLLFDPSQNFKPGEEITVNLTSGIKSDSGNVLAPYAWSFRAEVNNGSGQFNAGTQSFDDVGGGIALADFDNDNDLDLFFGTDTDENANEIWFNNGFGIYTKSEQQLIHGNVNTIAHGDLDNDGDIDLITGSLSSDLRVWENDGFGTFTNRGDVLNNTMSGGIDLGDFDGDGYLDLYVSRRSEEGGGNQIWFNDQNGGFSKSLQTLADTNGRNGAIGDLDNDGDMDIFASNNGGNTILLNDGHGHFTENGQSLGSSETWQSIIGDVDGDGDLDAYSCNEIFTNKLWLNDGSGNFTDSGLVFGQISSRSAAFGDVDGDGDLDIIVTNVLFDDDELWLNDGNGIFTKSNVNLRDTLTLTVELGDLDNDGDLDAVFGAMDIKNDIWFNTVIYQVYLPLTVNNYANVVPVDPPAVPVLNDIDNADGNGSYQVTWNDVDQADSYVLEEANNSSFSGAVEIYNGDSTSYAVSGKALGTYYYRVKAVNVAGESGWSNIKSAIVSNTDPSIMLGDWSGTTNYGGGVSFDVIEDTDLYVNSFGIFYRIYCTNTGYATESTIVGDSLIVNNYFLVNNFRVSISGSFTSATTSNGTWSVSYKDPVLGNCSGSGTWSANPGN